MSLFQSSSRQQIKPHAHTSGDRCPLCEQPIALEIARKIEARRHEQHAGGPPAGPAEAAAAPSKRLAAARAEAKAAAEHGPTGEARRHPGTPRAAEQARGVAAEQQSRR